MSRPKIVFHILAIMMGSLFLITHAQASTDINGMSQCMMFCKGDKSCIKGCIAQYTPPETSSDIAQCLTGCGLGISSQSDNATLLEYTKACCQGCLGSMH